MIENSCDTSTKIPAIPTVYKDYKFRSRLEARWAVFFDALGIIWEYETEGYNINHTKYLPDFWLQEFGCFVEIKPIPQEGTLYNEFRSVTNSAIVLICGTPWNYTATWYGFDSCDSGGGCYEDECKIIAPGAIVVKCERKDRTLLASQWERSIKCIESHELGWDWEKCKALSHMGTVNAITKAKRARFEHGETP